MNSHRELRIGIIGCDTSHASEFTARLNDAKHSGHVPGARVVAAHPTVSPDMPWSQSRAAGFVEELQTRHAVEMVGSIEALLKRCDAVLLCSLDGRAHSDQVAPVLRAGLPVFLDKPVAGSLHEAERIYELAAETGTPLFSSSALRWYPGIQALAAADAGTVRGAISYGPAPIEPTHPDLFFYGIHPTEALFTVLGTGCVSVQRTTTPHLSLVTGLWGEGKLGTLHALHRWPAEYKVIKFGDAAVVEQQDAGDYTPLLKQITAFFSSGVAPVSPAETLEIYAFMEAADESKRRGGARVELNEVRGERWRI
ncbi:MAG: Gfo/Idh/MocA family protein [Verrucomicrobium sp.]